MNWLARARLAQIKGDFRLLGSMIRVAPSGLVRARLLMILACEVALRRQQRGVALHLMKMSRSYMVDEYKALRRAVQAEWMIRMVCKDPDFCDSVIAGRSENQHHLNSD